MRWGTGTRLTLGSLCGALALTIAAAPADARRYAYVSIAGPGQVAALDIAADGALSAVAGSPFAAGSGAAAVALTPDGRFLYAANSNAGTISGFAVGISGGLAALPGSPTPVGAAPRAVAISPSGRHLYVANAGPSTISAFAIDAAGALTALPGSPVAAGNVPSGLALTPDGRQLFVANQYAGTIASYALGADGAPTLANASAATVSGPIGLALTPDGKRLFASGTVPMLLSSQGLVTGFAIGAGGVLTNLPGSPAVIGPNGGALAVAPNGTRVFAASPGSAQVSALDIGADGGLTAAPGSPVATPARARGVAITPNGNTLLVGGDSGGLLSQAPLVASYAVGANGGLTGNPGSPFSAGSGGQVDYLGLAISPNQPPTAALAASSAGNGTFVFDATASTDSDGSVVRYDWDFGDGTKLANGGATATHTYSTSDNYTVTLIVTDSENCSLIPIYTGQTASCNGGGSALSTRTVEVDSSTSGGGGGGGGGGGSDVTVSARRGQPVDRAIEVAVSCSQACEAEGKGKLFLFLRKGGGRGGSGKRPRSVRELRLSPGTVSVEAGQTAVLSLKVPAKARKLAKSKRSRKTTATINVVVTGADQNSRNEPIRVRLGGS